MLTLTRFEEIRIADAILAEYPRLSATQRTAARAVLFGRREWARRLLAKIDHGDVAVADVSTDELRQIALYNDPQLDATVRKRGGNIRAGTPEEKLADIRRNLERPAGRLGSAVGRARAVQEKLAVCHTLFNEGNKIGPDLTTANRKDRDFLLVSIVDPSVQVRKEFLAYVVHTSDGRVYTGLLTGQNPSSVTVVGAKNEHTTIPRNDIEEIKESPISLMPEHLIDQLKPQEVRDLFSYLETK